MPGDDEIIKLKTANHFLINGQVIYFIVIKVVLVLVNH